MVETFMGFPKWFVPKGDCVFPSRSIDWLGYRPPTVKTDGPFGVGSLQLFIPCDFEEHYFHILEDPRNHEALQRICLFDFVANSTDRKGGHCLRETNGKIWGIDNGLTFHVDFKLRTVIWDWAGLEIPELLTADLEKFVDCEVGDDLLEF